MLKKMQQYPTDEVEWARLRRRYDVKATHRISTSAAQHKTQANVRQTDEKMEEER
jgi:hypothetical protein